MLRRALLFLFAAPFAFPAGLTAEIAFTDQAGAAGLADARENNGAAWGDWDNDGDPDLLVFQLDRGRGALAYRNRGDGTFAAEPELLDAPPDQVLGGAFVDWDSDGDLDIYLNPLFRSHQLQRNDNGVFVRVDLLESVTANLAVTGGAFADFDGDGRLDLFGSHRFFTPNRFFTHLDGEGFTDQSRHHSLLTAGHDTFGAVPVDFDNDRDLDIYVSNFGAPNLLHRNDGRGAFAQVAGRTGADRSTVSVAALPGDWDNDGDFDLYLVNSLEEENLLLRNTGGRFETAESGAGLGGGRISLGGAWGDWDNDGDLDLAVSHTRGENVLENLGNGGFREVEVEALPGGDDDGRGVAVADYDLDGDLDFFVASRGGTDRLWRNEAPGTAHWLGLELAGRGDGRTALGTRVEILTPNGVQVRQHVKASMLGSVHGGALHFGLGAHRRVQRLTVEWASGLRQEFTDVEADRVLRLIQPQPRSDLGLQALVPGPNPAWEELEPQARVENLGLKDWADVRLRLRVSGPAGLEYDRAAPVPALPAGTAAVVSLPPWAPTIGGAYEFDFSLVFDGGEADEVAANNAWRRSHFFHRFDEVGGQAGLADVGPGWDGALGDYDLDGDLDLYLANGGVQGDGQSTLFRNEGDLSFTEVGRASGTASQGNGTGAVFADFDRDGRPDLFVARGGLNGGAQPNSLYHNLGDGTFEDVAAQSGLGGSQASFGGAPGDWDGDGFLDLYLGQLPGYPNRLYRNRGDGTFEDVSDERDIFSNEGVPGTAARFADWDNDGDLDLYAAFFGTFNVLYAEAGQAALVRDLAGDDDGNTTDLAVGDYDGDGDLDLYEVNFSGRSFLYRNELGARRFSDASVESGTQFQGAARGGAFVDWDNDGDLDLMVAGGDTTVRAWVNLGDGTFEDRAAAFGLADVATAQSVLPGDLDGDGDTDLYLIDSAGPNRLWRNGGAGNAWLRTRAAETGGGEGLGLRLQAFAGGRQWTRTIETDGARAHFGLGRVQRVDSLVVHWPGGRSRSYAGTALPARVTLHQGGTATAVETGATPLPATAALAQNAPNPFNPSTSIEYSLDRAGAVRLTVYNSLGQPVRRLVDGQRQAGAHRIVWRGRDDSGRAVGSGVYFYRLEFGDFSRTRAALLLR